MRPDPYKVAASKKHLAKQRQRGQASSTPLRERQQEQVPGNEWRFDQEDADSDSIENEVADLKRLLESVSTHDTYASHDLSGSLALNVARLDSIMDSQPFALFDSESAKLFDVESRYLLQFARTKVDTLNPVVISQGNRTTSNSLYIESQDNGSIEVPMPDDQQWLDDLLG
jgi:uncharacterized FlaG/YvyC family protein